MKIPLTVGLSIVKGKFIMTKFHKIFVICLILFAILSVYFFIPAETEFFKGADEGYYFNYAAAIIERGMAGFPYLIKSHIENPQSYLVPPPSRVGHVLFTALWLRLFGASFTNLFKFSFFCYVLFILVNIYYSRKIFGKDIAYLFALLVSSSPLVMAMGKRALSESNLNLFSALSLWTFMDFLVTKKKSRFFVFLLFYSLCVTVKESSLLFVVFFIAFFLIYKYYFKNPIRGIYFANIALLWLVIGSIFYIVLFIGGFGNFINLAKAVISAHFGGVKFSPYAVLFCTGPWYRFIIDYLLLAPITTLLFIGYFVNVLVLRKWEWRIVYFLLYFIVIFNCS